MFPLYLPLCPFMPCMVSLSFRVDAQFSLILFFFVFAFRHHKLKVSTNNNNTLIKNKWECAVDIMWAAGKYPVKTTTEFRTKKGRTDVPLSLDDFIVIVWYNTSLYHTLHYKIQGIQSGKLKLSLAQQSTNRPTYRTTDGTNCIVFTSIFLFLW